jgi:cytochrome P450
MAPPRPELSLDLYADDAIRDPHPRYRAIRDCAPAVWLPAHQVWALGRYDDVRAALRADGVLVSGRGVALNEMVNRMPTAITLVSDGDVHRKRRGVLMRPMMPSALVLVRAEIEQLADALVADLAGRAHFDGIADFARHLPVAVVSRLVGLPRRGASACSSGRRRRSTRWARRMRARRLPPARSFRWRSTRSP